MHRRLTRRAAASLAVGLAVTLPPATAAAPPSSVRVVPAAAAASSPDATSVALGTTETVTLITGDVVHVQTQADGRLAVEVDPVDERDGFQIAESDDELMVLPEDAIGAVARGVVDRRLFDVRYLVEHAMTDANSRTVPVIVVDGDRYPGLARGRSATSYEPRASDPRFRPSPYGNALRLPSIDGVAIEVPRHRAAELWTDLRRGDAVSGAGADVRSDRVWLDAPTRAVLDESVPLVGAPEMWQAGYDGTGVRVAVLDTGWDPQHPDLAGKVAASADFTGSASVVDRNGHGTHVLSTVLGQGTASDGQYRGVAPGATGLVAKVLNDRGNGALSWAIAGAEWAVANDADIVSMSIGSDPSPGNDPLSLAIDQLTASTDTLFVAAAGNSGPTPSTIGAPGSAASALTVGNVFKEGPINDSSGAGPRLGDGVVKPEVTAPGSQIVAARAANTFLGTPVGTHYATLSGTSMATPHVAGVAALVRQRHPDWTSADLRAALTASAEPTSDASIYRQGAGMVDAVDAAALTVLPQAATLSYGRFGWPHDGDDPVTRTQTYRNTSGAPIELDLAAELADVEGTAATVALSADSLTIPAGAAASVDVTIDVDDLATPGDAEGMMTATLPDGATVRTPIGVVKDPETFTIDVTATQRDGRPAVSPSSMQVLNLRTGQSFFAATAPNAQITVPRGTYAVLGWVYTMDASNTEDVEATLAGDPEVVVDEDVHVELDARPAVPVAVDFKRDVDIWSQSLGWGWTATEGSGLDASFRGSSTLRRMSVVPSGPVSRDGFETYAKWEVVPPRARLRTTQPDRVPIDTWLLSGSAPVDGTHDLTVFDGGAGSPEDLAGSTGKAVVVRRTDGVSVPTQVRAAQDAGAAVVLVANNRPGVFDPGAGSGIVVPVLSVSQRDGDRLIEQTATRVELSGTDVRRARFLYDVVLAYPDRLPSQASVREQDLDLAVLDTAYAGSQPDQAGAELRHHWRPMTGASIAFRREMLLPLHRIDYVSASDSRWQQTVRAATPFSAELVERTQQHQPGTRKRSFFGAPIAPGPQEDAADAGPQNAAVTRREDLLTVDLPLFRDSDPSHVGGADSADAVTARILRDGEPIHTGRSLATSIPVPAPEAVYTIEADVTRTGDHWATSTRTSSTWRFRSSRPAGLEPVAPPLIDVRVKVRGLDGLNRTSDRSSEVWIKAGYQQHASGPGISQLMLAQSTDGGTTWTPVRLERSQGGYVGEIANPRHGAVSLRWSASDRAGSGVTQMVANAYLVD